VAADECRRVLGLDAEECSDCAARYHAKVGPASDYRTAHLLALSLHNDLPPSSQILLECRFSKRLSRVLSSVDCQQRRRSRLCRREDSGPRLLVRQRRPKAGLPAAPCRRAIPCDSFERHAGLLTASCARNGLYMPVRWSCVTRDAGRTVIAACTLAAAENASSTHEPASHSASPTQALRFHRAPRSGDRPGPSELLRAEFLPFEQMVRRRATERPRTHRYFVSLGLGVFTGVLIDRPSFVPSPPRSRKAVATRPGPRNVGSARHFALRGRITLRFGHAVLERVCLAAIFMCAGSSIERWETSSFCSEPLAVGLRQTHALLCARR